MATACGVARRQVARSRIAPEGSPQSKSRMGCIIMARTKQILRRRFLSAGRLGKLGLCLLAFCLAGATVASAQSTPAPRLFFTDLDAGPNSGGESVSGFAGAYVTLFGNFLGTNPTVTLNGANCLRVVGAPVKHLWYQKVVVQLGPSCASGKRFNSCGSPSPVLTMLDTIPSTAAVRARAEAERSGGWVSPPRLPRIRPAS